MGAGTLPAKVPDRLAPTPVNHWNAKKTMASLIKLTTAAPAMEKTNSTIGGRSTPMPNAVKSRQKFKLRHYPQVGPQRQGAAGWISGYSPLGGRGRAYGPVAGPPSPERRRARVPSALGLETARGRPHR
jgi:hypothetical protein